MTHYSVGHGEFFYLFWGKIAPSILGNTVIILHNLIFKYL